MTLAAVTLAAGTLGWSSVRAAICTDPAAWSAKAAGTTRWKHTSIWNPVAKKVIVFGGTDGTTVFDDVRSYDPANDTWTTIPTVGGPARYSHTAIYDPIGYRMIVFGGMGTGSANPWALSLSNFTWTDLAPGNTGPGFKSDHCAIFDPIRNAMIFTGGAPADSPHEAWMLALWISPPLWLPLADFGGAPRQGASAVYDPVANRMLVTGGRYYSMGTLCSVTRYTELLDTWALSMALTPAPAWSEVTTSGYPGTGSYAGAFYEPQCRSLVVYGGVNYGQSCSFGHELHSNNGVPHLRILNLTTGAWTFPAPTSGGPPAGRGFLSLAYDPVAKRAYVHGGGTSYETYGNPFDIVHNTVLSDTWSLKMPDVTPPAAVEGLSVVGCTMGSLTLWWNAPADDDGGAVASYELRSSSVPVDDSNWDAAIPVSGVPAPTAPGTGQTMVVGGLGSCTWNYFAMKAIDASNNVSAISNSAGGRTKCKSTSPCITDGFRAQPVTENPGVESLELTDLTPNPAQSDLRIRFGVPSGALGRISLGIYDIVGRRVANVLEADARAGMQDARWDLRDSQGRRVARGIYWVRLSAGSHVRNQMVVVR